MTRLRFYRSAEKRLERERERERERGRERENGRKRNTGDRERERDGKKYNRFSCNRRNAQK